MDAQLVWMVGAIFVSIAAATAAIVWLLTDPQFSTHAGPFGRFSEKCILLSWRAFMSRHTEHCY